MISIHISGTVFLGKKSFGTYGCHTVDLYLVSSVPLAYQRVFDKQTQKNLNMIHLFDAIVL